MHALNLFLFICILKSVILTAKGGYIQISIREGSIIGKTGITHNLNKKYYAFQGIPYAEPPERFEVAVPKKPWKDVLNCTYDKSECVQGVEEITGSEDCLFLSVYTTNLTSTSAVIIWIHGGRFFSGNASYEYANPENFLDEDLVVVSIQYRLGVFGFLSTEDLNCPGNFGLKDQVLALEWVQKNIRHFGGDKKNVTIFGQSAGAISVALHSTSEKSKGLFKGAIMNSGVSISSLALTRNALKTAYTIGSSPTSTKLLVQRLKTMDYRSLQLESNSVVMSNPGLFELPFGPVIEPPHPTAFLTKRSDELLVIGNFSKVPMLLGFTSNEMMIWQSVKIPITKDGIEEQIPLLSYLHSQTGPIYDSNLSLLVPTGIHSNRNLTEAGFKIKSKFWVNKSISSSVEDLIQFRNVDQYVRPINRFVKNVCKYDPQIYYYIFSYQGKLPGVSSEGVAHCDDILYFFNSDTNHSKEDDEMIKKVVKMWANFCKFGKPIPYRDLFLENANWESACSTQVPYLFNINSTMSKIDNPYQELLDFYENEIFDVYGQGVYDTY
ncbi:juvenile hormone esterase-like [Diorhabda sublineata]|uniref:juvenile hormone esterase-like n=1 Tax=Diorhabda sublineata TaxID=1163346 RepID=UPI0024E122AD|nr:juvenile hormone esterase-like [Diorhabda sublineata]